MNGSDSTRPSIQRFNYVVAGLMVVLAAVIARGTFFVTRARADVSMPQVFPGALIVLLLVLAVMLVVKTRAGTLPAIEGERISPAGHRKAATVFAIAVAYPLVMPFIGFFIATVLALVAFSLVLGERRRLLILGYALAFALLVHGIFVVALRVPLPAGLLFE
jgi:putative tricarboxylic transport membrane protein